MPLQRAKRTEVRRLVRWFVAAALGCGAAPEPKDVSAPAPPSGACDKLSKRDSLHVHTDGSITNVDNLRIPDPSCVVNY